MDTDIDFGDANNWNETMPERTKWLRENDPVYWSEKTGAFIISRYEDVTHVSKHNEIFCSGEGVLPGPLAPKIGLIDEDEPRHHRDAQPDQPRLHAAHGEEVGGQSFQADHRRDALDAIADKKGDCDFVEDIAVPLPLILIAEMIGIRREDRRALPPVVRCNDRRSQGNARQAGGGGGLGQGRGRVHHDYVTEVIDEPTREKPKDDLISHPRSCPGRRTTASSGSSTRRRSRTLIEFPAPSEQREMSNDELIKMCILLMVAGNETTRNGL